MCNGKIMYKFCYTRTHIYSDLLIIKSWAVVITVPVDMVIDRGDVQVDSDHKQTYEGNIRVAQQKLDSLF